MREVLNCPNCGAPIDGEKCQYCGTVFYDFAAIDMDKPSYIKMRINGKLLMFKAILTNVEIKQEANTTDYAYGRFIRCAMPDMTVSAEFHVIDDNGVLYRLRKE